MWNSEPEMFYYSFLLFMLKTTTEVVQISAHFKNYERLKGKDPVCARGELYRASYLLHKNHKKSDLWAEFVYEMDTKGTLSLYKMLAFEQLQLQLAIDTYASNETIQTHKEVVASTQARVDSLIAEGKDPQEVRVDAYNFDFLQNPNLWQKSISDIDV